MEGGRIGGGEGVKGEGYIYLHMGVWWGYPEVYRFMTFSGEFSWGRQKFLRNFRENSGEIPEIVGTLGEFNMTIKILMYGLVSTCA